MGNKEKIDYLLLDIRELEKLVAGMRDAEVYPVSFFSQTFDLTHKILNDLHVLENDQLETLRKQMEEHQALINAIPHTKAQEHPVMPEIIKEEIHAAEPVIAPEPIAIKPIPVETTAERHTVSIHEVLEKQNLSDLRKAFSLNDKFYFRKELFNGDEAKMSKVLSDLNDIHSYEESVAYLNEKLNWNIEDPTVSEFLKLMEKRFL